MTTPTDARRAKREAPPDLAHWRMGERGVELLEASFHSHVYERHIHETYAIGVTLKGIQRFWCRGTIRNSVPGDIVAINPGEAHDGKSGTDAGYAYRMLYIPATWMRAIVDDALEYRGQEVFVNAPILKDPGLAAELCAAWDSMAAPSLTFAGDALLYEALLALVVRHAGVRPACRRTVDERVMRRVKDCLHSRVEEGIRVQELADLAGMSRFQLTRQFQRAFGLPLHAFHLHLKLEEGKRRLRSGVPIARIATDLGFADQSHFHRRFKGMFGASPDAWRRSTARS
jgi:AraC-like DNA-binding protein